MMSSTAECHLLPCDIEYDGNAPVHVFFRPTPVASSGQADAATIKKEQSESSDDDQTKNENETSTSADKNSSQDPTILAAQLRGRGLLCVDPTTLPDAVVGTVVSTEHATRAENGNAYQQGGGGVELVGGTFTAIHEWHHEHDVRSLKRAELKGNGVTGRALEWMEVARSVHDPIE